MTLQEAIKILKINCVCSPKATEFIEASNVAAEAIEKRIPMPLDYEGDGYADDGNILYDTAICCGCGRRFERYCEEHYKYCPGCGQALNWGEEEKEE